MATSNPNKIETAAKFVFGTHTEIDPKLVGAARLEALRPNKGLIPGGFAWVWVALVGTTALWVLSAFTFPFVGELALLFAAYTLAVRVIVRKKQRVDRGRLWRSARQEFRYQEKFFWLILVLALGFLIRQIGGLILWIESLGQPSGIDPAMVVPTGVWYIGFGIFGLGNLIAILAGVATIPFIFRIAGVVAKGVSEAHEATKFFMGKDGLLKHVFDLPVVNADDERAVTQLDNGDVRIFPVPIRAKANFDMIEQNLYKKRLDDFMLKPGSTPDDITLTLADDETRARRKMQRQTEGLISMFDPETGAGELGDKCNSNNLATVQELLSQQGFSLIEHNLRVIPKQFRATAVTADEAAVYKSVSLVLGVPVWEFRIEFEWRANDEADKGMVPVILERLVISGSPAKGLTPEAREVKWQAVISGLLKGSNGWKIHDVQATGVTTLTYGKPLSLPDRFSTRDTLPTAQVPGEWNLIPLGVNSANRMVYRNLLDVPHALIAGGTNSGKSTLLRQDIVSCLVRGHDIVILDTFKQATDLATLKPWTLMWSEEITETANVLAMIWEEFIRRRRVLKRYKIGSWHKLDAAIREDEGIRPMSVFYDEYENSVVSKSVPKSLPKDHPIVLKAIAVNTAVDYVRDYMPELAKGARSVGIFLNAATQTPHADAVGTSLRPNLGAAIQLAAGKMEPHIVRLTMGEATSQALAQFAMFNKPAVDDAGNEIRGISGEVKVLPGLGVILAPGGAPDAFRVAFSDEYEAPKILEDFGIPTVSPWKIIDALELGMKRTEDEEDDAARPRIQPPFSQMTHLRDEDLPEPESSDDSEAVGEPEPVGEPETEDPDDALLKRILDRNRPRHD